MPGLVLVPLFSWLSNWQIHWSSKWEKLLWLTSLTSSTLPTTVSPYKTCPGGNSVIAICGYPCVISCTKFHLGWEEFGTLWLSNFEVKYLSWVLKTSTHAFSFGFPKTACKLFPWVGRMHICDTECLTCPSLARISWSTPQSYTHIFLTVEKKKKNVEKVRLLDSG